MDIPQGANQFPHEFFQVWETLQTDPISFPIDVLGIPENYLWWGARKMIRAIFQHKNVAVHSGHSVSKDWSAGIITLMWLIKYWGNAKVICTAPKMDQVKNIMFEEIEKQYTTLRERFPEFREEWLKTVRLDFGPQCYAMGMTSKETHGLVGKGQGYKSENLLIIVTEAQALEPSAYKQLHHIMTASNNRILLIGNPLMEFGDFYDACTNPALGFHVIHLSSLDSPNVVAGKNIIPGMCSIEYVERFKLTCDKDYENDPEWQSHILGEFPQQSNFAWIPLNKIKQAVDRVIENDDEIKVGGLDVARMGNDETVHTVLCGRKQVTQDHFKKRLTQETVGWARALIEDGGLKTMAIDLGYDPGVVDWLQYENISAFGVNFGGKSPLEKFQDLGTFMWWLLRKAFLDNDISIKNDPVLVSQLASRVVIRTPKGKIKLEPKKKDGKASPDRADALVLAWYARWLVMGGNMSVSDADSEMVSAKVHSDIEKVFSSERKTPKDVDSAPRIEDARDDIGWVDSETEGLGL